MNIRLKLKSMRYSGSFDQQEIENGEYNIEDVIPQDNVTQNLFMLMVLSGIEPIVAAIHILEIHLKRNSE